MITVSYEKYWCDYHRNHETQSFGSLAELEEWIFGQMKRDYSKDRYAMSIPTPAAAERIHSDGPWSIEFRPDHTGPDFWIHEIRTGEGIIFTDGKLTSGQTHWSKEVKEWLTRMEERRISPKFNFVE